MAADPVTQQRQPYHQPGRDEGSFYSEQTPVPNEYRPPPPTFQPTSMASRFASAKGGSYENHRQHQESTSLLNSTLLSLSVDEVGTLPSLTFNPPSPLSQPSQSLFEDHKANNNNENKNKNTKTATSPSSSSLSLARRRRQQRVQNNGSKVSELSQQDNNAPKNPPMQEVYMNGEKSNRSDNDKDYHQQDSPSTVGGENDTFFECVEDRILANRAMRTMRTDVHSSPSRSVLSSLDGQQGVFSNPYGQPLENIQENIPSGDVVRVHESALNALQQLKEELVKSNQRNEELTREREIWKDEEQHLREEVMALKTTDRQKDTDLQRLREDHERLLGAKETTEQQRNDVVEEKKKLEAQSRDSTRTIKEFRHRILAGDNRHKELKGQLDKLNVELEGALAAKGELAAELARAQTDRMELESKLEDLRKQLSEATQAKEETTSEGQRLEEELRVERKQHQDLRASSESEIGRLNSSLRKANEALHRLRAELTPKVRSAVQQHQNHNHPSHHGNLGLDGIQHNTSMMTQSSSVGGTAFVPPGSPTLDSAIADRLARLRDSSERAHLIRAHKREIARVKADRDAKILQLESDHADALKKATKQWQAKQKSELEDLSQKLQREHESHLEDVEDEHRKRLSQLQKDYGRSQEEADESLEEALSKIARVTQDHGREKGRRHALERTVDDLQRKLQKQQVDLKAKHGAELEKRKRQWESEKEALLGNLQRECNIAFDNRRRGIGTNNTNMNNLDMARGNPIHIETSDTPRSIPLQVQGHHSHRPPTSTSHQQQRHHHQQQQQQHARTGPSPLSMDSASFFPEPNKNNSTHLKVIAPATHGSTAGGGTAYIVPSPRRPMEEMFAPTTTTGMMGGSSSPSVISRTYSDVDIDSVLRETEELVQSIL